MFGFSYLEFGDKEYKLSEEGSQFIEASDFKACSHLIDKFVDDKVFFNSERFFIVLDGVVINKKQLMHTMNNQRWQDTILKMYELYGDTFFDHFRGSFSGILKDKVSHKTIIFSDHIGSKILYYTKGKDYFYVTSFMPNIYSFLKDNHFSCSMSKEGAYMLLSHGYMLDDNTICEQAKRIFPGHYLVLENGQVYDKEYCRLSNQESPISFDDAVELLDSSFRQACVNEFEKDKEYCYEHLASLSGGLDSRMTTLVADCLGYKKQFNITFSQSGYWDEIIAQQIAEDYCHDWIFKNLDSGYWLLDFEKIINITGGNVLYYGQAHGNSLISKMNLTPFGILHSGQLGDVFVGRTYVGPKDSESIGEFQISDRAYSRKFIEKLNEYKFKYEYENREIGVLYNRGFNGINNGIVCIYEGMETYSPFLDIDFMRNALKIPVIWDNKYAIYYKWIETKYPTFMRYGWEALNGRKINEKKVSFMGRKFFKDEIPVKIKSKLLRMIGRNKTGQTQYSKHNMNPLSYYINCYPHINTVLDAYFKKNIYNVSDMELQNDLIFLYSTGNGAEKVQAITLIAANKLFFCR